MEQLIKKLTQKDENIAFEAAKELLDSANADAFAKLSEKSDFLFDFIKDNVCKRLYNAADENNYLNVINFFNIYDETYSGVLLSILNKYQNYNLRTEMLKLLKNGNENQRTYAAKYFEKHPYTEAKNILNELAFNEFQPLSVNVAKALAKLHDKTCIEKAYDLLKSDDSFDILKAISFLTNYPDLTRLDVMIYAAINSTMPENAACEIANAVNLYDLIINKQNENNLSLFNALINGLGEILPLYQIIDYKIFDITRALINQNYEEGNSQISQILLNMYTKFNMFVVNEEYTFDEDTYTKSELNQIVELLKNQSVSFWDEQKELIFDEISQNQIRILSALQVIKELKLDNCIDKLLELKDSANETIICIMLETLASLNKIDLINFEEISQKITNPNLLAIAQNCLISPNR